MYGYTSNGVVHGMSEWKRNCPKCNIEVSHTLKANRDRLQKENKLCRTCGIKSMSDTKTGTPRGAWSRAIEGPWTRQCPSCGVQLFYKTETSKLRSEGNNRKCFHCKNDGMTDAQKEQISQALIGRKYSGKTRGTNTRDGKFSKSCPKCNAVMYYRRSDGMKRAIRDNTVCAKCANYVYDRTWKQVITPDHTKKMAATKAGYDSYDVYMGNKPEFDKYRVDVMKITREQNISILPNSDKTRGLNGVDGAHQLDHIVSIYEGFHKNISSEIIGNIANLQIIPWEENISKHHTAIPTLTEWLDSLQIAYTVDHTLTVFLPAHNIGIFIVDTIQEHNDFVNANHTRSTLVDMQNVYANAGVHVLFILDVEWYTKHSIITNKILHSIKYTRPLCAISGRKLDIRLTSSELTRPFLDKYHIQGFANAKYHIGAFHKDELVAVMTFSSPRVHMGGRSTPDVYELSRFVTATHYLVRGGFSKMLQWFIKNHTPIQIFSYAHGRFSKKTSNVYEQAGFAYDSTSRPNYYYIESTGYSLLYRYSYTKYSLIEKGFDATMSESEIMKSRGYRRVWETGHHKYILNCGSVDV
jgi:hypothetical protein